ncbi:metallopeptidase MepB [Pochonia chlamydosporia 170]|uniref:Metallopeptidase MepB n=1 Tax=Pochonia chlamydosporia 170 TaxID=1380566 RepID=A0A179EZK9_METCM|nr:metallopeptidase MepB [Pochonia chlamydosporia 170]OAQ58339.1 metallopeptidase MepB [Pochonia chlamydosporia 170]
MTNVNIPDKYRNPPQAPPVFTSTKDSILDDVNLIIEEQRGLLGRIASSFTPETATFEGVVEAIARANDQASRKDRVLTFYQKICPDSELRKASNAAKRALQEFSTECMMRDDIFKLVDALHRKKASLGLDPESLRLLEKAHKGYISNGLGIPLGPQRDRSREINARLISLGIEFNINLNEEHGCLWLTPEELQGIPEDVVSNLDKGSGENEGKLRLTFKYPHLYPTLKYAINPETRKRLIVANENKCNQNSGIFKKAIVLRHEAARLLGFKNHVDFKLQDRMAKSEVAVLGFLTDLQSRLTSAAQKELDHLKDIKAEDCKAKNLPNDGNYYLWDHRYYDRLMLEKEYSINELQIAEYFSLDITLAKLLNIFETLLGFVFIKLDDDELAKLSPTGKAGDVKWHVDNIVYSVWNDESEGDEFVGYLYMDLHPRQGKYSHAANTNLEPGFTLRDGTRHYPATALICNFSEPTRHKPSLLKHHEVVTLFHELGHGIHNLASRTLYTRFHGTATARDFVEAPSQMLENWCWIPSVAKSLSQHWRTKEQIPDSLAERLVSTRDVNSAMYNLGQVHFAMFDMICHSPKSDDEVMAIDPSVLFNNLRASITLVQGLEDQTQTSDWSHGDAIFSHLMSGYDAGLYGYLYSNVYSTDMFNTVFGKDPMNETQGRRYRHTVLEYGGSRDELVSLEEFLGRKPNSEAFYQNLGIA